MRTSDCRWRQLCVSQHCVYKKRKKEKRTHRRGKKEKPKSHEHTRAPNVCETLPRQRGKKKFSNPLSTTRRWNAALKYALHTCATWRDLTYTALTFYTATRTRKRASIIRTVTEPTFSPPHINPSPRAICKLKMALRRGEKNFVARRITRISG